MSCSATKPTQQPAPETSMEIEQPVKSQELSNYFLFDQIQQLQAEDYYTLLDSVKNGASDDFFTLRTAYSKTGDYAPYSTDSTLMKVRDLIEFQHYREALNLLKNHQKENWVSILSHYYSGYINEKIGDTLTANYHYNIYEELLYSVYNSGDGKTPETAFIVIAAWEEYALMNWLDLEICGQSRVNADDFVFDLLEGCDPIKKDKFNFYFNIEVPQNYTKPKD
jgi:hypothetical protein